MKEALKIARAYLLKAYAREQFGVETEITSIGGDCFRVGDANNTAECSLNGLYQAVQDFMLASIHSPSFTSKLALHISERVNALIPPADAPERSLIGSIEMVGFHVERRGKCDNIPPNNNEKAY